MSFRPQLTPGTVLGRYELLLPVAQGGMACVWAARLKGSHGFAKTVAVKTMLPLLSDDPAFEEMFLQEAEVASRIHHPNVAEILDLGEVDEALFLVMEWIDGEPLSVVLKMARKNGVQIPMRITLRIATQICAGLHAAHELRDDSDQPLGLVHRDVSPQNILLNRDGLVKMVDFGIAKAVARAGAETGAGTVKGKVPYLSPEQIKGKAIDRRADIFALGVILYRMTTGTHPFLGDTDAHTMRNTVSRPVLPPHVKHPNFCRPLEKVILRCLQKEQDKRFENMAAVERALEEVMLSEANGLVPHEEVASFVRGLLGDREKKRSIALRDAARAIDDRLPVTDDIMEIPDEDVSGLLLTETMTPTTQGSAVDTDVSAPDLSAFEGDATTTPTPDSIHTGPSGTPATSLTSAMMSSDPTAPQASTARRMAWLLGAVAALGAGALAIRQLGASATPVDPSDSAGVEGAPPTEERLDAKPSRTLAPPGAGIAKKRGLRVDELPSVDASAAAPEPDRATPTSGGRARPPTSKGVSTSPVAEPASPPPTSEPSASAKVAAPPEGDEPPSAPETPWVPTVQDPGF